MITLGIKSNFDAVTRSFTKTADKQVQFATSLAINRCAEFARDALKANMSVVFDRPKPYTLNSLFVKKSNKIDLVAIVGHKRGSPVNDYLQPEIEGGTRKLKRFESIAGGEYLMPGAGMRLDRYGNVPRGTIQRIIEGSRQGANSDILIIKPGSKSHLKPGVYQRITLKSKVSTRTGTAEATRGGSRLKLLMLFVDSASYQQTYHLTDIVHRVVGSQFGSQFVAAMDYALGTARF